MGIVQNIAASEVTDDDINRLQMTVLWSPGSLKKVDRLEISRTLGVLRAILADARATPSGSGDHAELASECVRGLQSIEDRICESDPFRFTEGTIYAKSIRVIEAFLAENAALRAANTEAERKLAEANTLNDRAADLMRQCTDPERFEGASTLNVYANMRAWLSDLSKEAERG